MTTLHTTEHISRTLTGSERTDQCPVPGAPFMQNTPPRACLRTSGMAKSDFTSRHAPIYTSMLATEHAPIYTSMLVTGAYRKARGAGGAAATPSAAGPRAPAPTSQAASTPAPRPPPRRSLCGTACGRSAGAAVLRAEVFSDPARGWLTGPGERSRLMTRAVELAGCVLRQATTRQYRQDETTCCRAHRPDALTAPPNAFLAAPD